MPMAKPLTPDVARETSDARVPRHIAIIMDGNGRWAAQRGLPRKLGHQRGAEALKAMLEGCRDSGVKYFTVYAFSSENWKREPDEVTDLMDLMRFYLRREVKHLNKNNTRVQFIGNREKLAPDIQDELRAAEALTANNTGLHLSVALSYGARQEMMSAMARMATAITEGTLTADAIDEHTVQLYLDTANLPDPDLLIRTGGDMRLSNFLLWQCAYTELYFTETLWPDFAAEDIKRAIEEYGQRERRFGTRQST